MFILLFLFFLTLEQLTNAHPITENLEIEKFSNLTSYPEKVTLSVENGTAFQALQVLYEALNNTNISESSRDVIQKIIVLTDPSQNLSATVTLNNSEVLNLFNELGNASTLTLSLIQERTGLDLPTMLQALSLANFTDSIISWFSSSNATTKQEQVLLTTLGSATLEELLVTEQSHFVSTQNLTESQTEPVIITVSEKVGPETVSENTTDLVPESLNTTAQNGLNESASTDTGAPAVRQNELQRFALIAESIERMKKAPASAGRTLWQIFYQFPKNYFVWFTFRYYPRSLLMALEQIKSHRFSNVPEPSPDPATTIANILEQPLSAENVTMIAKDNEVLLSEFENSVLLRSMFVQAPELLKYVLFYFSQKFPELNVYIPLNDSEFVLLGRPDDLEQFIPFYDQLNALLSKIFGGDFSKWKPHFDNIFKSFINYTYEGAQGEYLNVSKYLEHQKAFLNVVMKNPVIFNAIIQRQDFVAAALTETIKSKIRQALEPFTQLHENILEVTTKYPYLMETFINEPETLKLYLNAVHKVSYSEPLGFQKAGTAVGGVKAQTPYNQNVLETPPAAEDKVTEDYHTTKPEQDFSKIFASSADTKGQLFALHILPDGKIDLLPMDSSESVKLTFPETVKAGTSSSIPSHKGPGGVVVINDEPTIDVEVEKPKGKKICAKPEKVTSGFLLQPVQTVEQGQNSQDNEIVDCSAPQFFPSQDSLNKIGALPSDGVLSLQLPQQEYTTDDTKDKNVQTQKKPYIIFEYAGLPEESSEQKTPQLDENLLVDVCSPIYLIDSKGTAKGLGGVQQSTAQTQLEKLPASQVDCNPPIFGEPLGLIRRVKSMRTPHRSHAVSFDSGKTIEDDKWRKAFSSEYRLPLIQYEIHRNR